MSHTTTFVYSYEFCTLIFHVIIIEYIFYYFVLGTSIPRYNIMLYPYVFCTTKTYHVLKYCYAMVIIIYYFIYLFNCIAGAWIERVQVRYFALSIVLLFSFCSSRYCGMFVRLGRLKLNVFDDVAR